MRPLVSITTVTYNSEKTLARTIESVLNQTYADIEYLIIDGKSTDKTVAIANAYCEKMKQRGIKYRIISEQDHGMYDAINKGIALATGDIVGNINSDDWYEKDAIEKVVACFEKTGCDFMYADLRMIRPDGSSFIKHSKESRIVTSRGWNHPTQFAKRQLYIDNPYKVESLHDDFDLLLRISNKDYKIAILNEVLANFTMEGMSHKRSISESFKRGKARYQIYRNNGYSKWYILECVFIETAKLILG